MEYRGRCFSPFIYLAALLRFRGGGGDLASPNASRSGYDPDYDPEEGANDRLAIEARACAVPAV
eukprot:986090-Amphidinium_carterae.1